MLIALDGSKRVEIITSHNGLDFDGLASMVGASKLYPGAVMVIPGTVSKNIQQFMGLYKDSLFIKTPREIDITKVKRTILVDTANPDRLGELKGLTGRPEMDFHIYDHHPASEEDLQGSVHETNKLGATTTMMVEKIIEHKINISPFDATILALGIYEDTGSLLFPSTTERDARAVAYLLSCRANLKVVANFIEQPFSEAQRQILHGLLDSIRHYPINNVDIVIAIHNGEAYIPGLDLVTYRLAQMEQGDAIFVIASMQGKINVIARSATASLRVNEVLKNLGGRGHERAASAIIRGKTCQQVAKLIIEQINERIRPSVTAREIMSTPVKTVALYKTMEDAGRIMLRYGHTGMPVVDGNKVVGMISRRDVDKAIVHELGHAPVKGFMTTDVLSISPDTPIGEIQKIVVENDVGRLPVVENGSLVGIVSRTDILRILHGEDYPEDHELMYPLSEGGIENFAVLMQSRLPANIFAILQIAGEVAQELESTVYCVGGFVRDLFLEVPNFDVDLVVEGDGRQLAIDLARKLHGKVRIHERFATATIILEDAGKIDIATARTEYYEFPAALPMVEKSSIREDMYRRDFTINTLAICLNPGKFGDLIDYFGGRKDIQNRYIRILYNLSFVEDPTRILRAIRFEQRYQFTIEVDTLRFARDAIERRLLGKLSYKRILQELILILSEKDPLGALRRMKETGVWQFILPEVQLDTLGKIPLQRIPLVIGWWNNRYGREVKAWLVYLLVILGRLSESQLVDVLKRLPLDKYAQRCIEDSAQIPQLAKHITTDINLPPSQLHRILNHLNIENLIYLLLIIKDENAWERIVNYLDVREQAKVEINGHDLKKLGLKPGPHFKEITTELFDLRLDGINRNREDEISTVLQWIKEGRF
jgi:tRNA nucleotidyltransferase (CCA-adding enzyme)